MTIRRFPAPWTRLGTTGLSVYVDEADPRDDERKRSSVRGYESVRRDAETTRYFL